MAGSLKTPPQKVKLLVVVALLWWCLQKGQQVVLTVALGGSATHLQTREEGKSSGTDREKGFVVVFFGREVLQENSPLSAGMDPGPHRSPWRSAGRSEVYWERRQNAIIYGFFLLFALILHTLFVYNSLWCLELLFIPFYQKMYNFISCFESSKSRIEKTHCFSRELLD